MAESTKPRFAGEEIGLGGTTYVVPPLALGQVKTLLPRIQAMTGKLSADDLDTMLDVITAATQRNYPDVTRAALEELVDLGNVHRIFSTVMGNSGLRKTSAEGNAEAVPATA